MNKLTKLAATVAISGALFAGFTTPAMAETVSQHQELNQTVKIECRTEGAYGQSTVCTAEGVQSGKQTQIVTIGDKKYVRRYRNDGTYRMLPYHKPEDTSVNSMTISGLIATAVTTAGAGFLTIKKRK